MGRRDQDEIKSYQKIPEPKFLRIVNKTSWSGVYNVVQLGLSHNNGMWVSLEPGFVKGSWTPA